MLACTSSPEDLYEDRYEHQSKFYTRPCLQKGGRQYEILIFFWGYIVKVSLDEKTKLN